LISSLSVSLFVTLWNYEVCDNANAMKQCNFQMVPLHRGRFVVMHLYSSFFYEPPVFSIRVKFIPKVTTFGV